MVQIDETKVGAKRKYNHGRPHPGLDMWFFGRICRQTKRAFVRLVADRTRETLLPIIQERILSGTTIYSDTWAPYFTLKDEGYIHEMVNHSEQYVRDDGVNTQVIECFWNTIKCELKI